MEDPDSRVKMVSLGKRGTWEESRLVKKQQSVVSCLGVYLCHLEVELMEITREQVH